MKIDPVVLQRAKELVFQEGRLLERLLFERFFGHGTKSACLRALCAYQNGDGGFGNGLEPDLLVPASTGIAAETALYTLDLLSYPHTRTLSRLILWLEDVVDPRGVIPHPPAEINDYPHQPWWGGPDEGRILSVLGLLRSLGERDPYLEAHTLLIAGRMTEQGLPEQIQLYDYPILLYALYTLEFPLRGKVLTHYRERLPDFLQSHAKHHPLWSRYWHCAIPLLPAEVVQREAERWIADLMEDGGLPNSYPQLPWWRSIFTLDGLCLLSKHRVLEN
ncbi:MAG: hypothetical protein WCO14_04270 [bacterium]